MADLRLWRLRAIPNPKGNGKFVYPRKLLGVRPKLLWIAIGDSAYPLNRASKNAVPQLRWPSEAPADLWMQTNLDPVTEIESIDAVFASQ
jgi:hypothetical protein